MSNAQTKANADQKSLIQEKLVSSLCQHYGSDVEVNHLKQLTGGASSQTWYFEKAPAPASTASNKPIKHNEALILRLGETGDDFFSGLSKTDEAATQITAFKQGIPCPKIIYQVDWSAEGLGSGYIMEHLKGETIPQKILKDPTFGPARQKMTQQCGHILAKMHQIPIAAFPQLPAQSTAQQLEALQAEYKRHNVSIPVFSLALTYLFNNIPACNALSLVHGDFRHGNFMVTESGISSLFDWELAHIGNPIEDLGWLCVNSWRFNQRELPVGGFGTKEALIESYEQAGGRAVSLDELNYWELYGSLRWGIIILQMSALPQEGTRSLERTAIGRRLSETELDIMVLLQELSSK